MVKKLLEEKVSYIQFSEEELDELGFEENQKFELSCEENGSVILKPYVKMEIDLEDFPKYALIHLMNESCEKDISINEVISNILMEAVEQYDV